jgi:hypothetical protein
MNIWAKDNVWSTSVLTLQAASNAPVPVRVGWGESLSASLANIAPPYPDSQMNENKAPQRVNATERNPKARANGLHIR